VTVDPGDTHSPFELGLMAYLVVTFVVCAVSFFRWRRREAQQREEGLPMGRFHGLRLSVVHDEDAGRAVALVFAERNFDRSVLVTPTHARQLAEWIRIAAGNGNIGRNSTGMQ
jgi:hypothetical protein